MTFAYNTLQTMVDAQREQQEELYPEQWQHPEFRHTLAMEMGSHLVGSIHSYLDAAGFKARTGANVRERENVRMEAFADVLKWTLAIATTEGWSGEQLAQSFWDKTEVVAARAKAIPAHEFPEHVASVDLDGVLVSFEARRWDVHFIEDGEVASLPKHSTGFELVKMLTDRGWGIVINTTRDIEKYPELELQTYKWLRLHKVPTLQVLFGHDKDEKLEPFGSTIRFHIDDMLKHCLDTAQADRPAFFFGTEDDIAARGIGLNTPGVIGISQMNQINLALIERRLSFD